MYEEGCILKPLTSDEYYIENEMKKLYFLFPNAYFIESKYNLFENLDLLQKSLHHWIELHPLLSSQIREETNKKRFFVYKKNSNLENVTFLNYKPSDTIVANDFWKLVFEREFSYRIESEKEFLWRLKIIDVGPGAYWFILSTHHGITDGRNVYAIVLELCDIIQNTFEAGMTQPTITQEQRDFSKLEYDYPNDPRVHGVDMVFKPFVPLHLETPKCVSPAEDENKRVRLYQNSNGVLYNLDGSVYLNIDSLVENRDKDHITGFQCFSISQTDFKRLLEKSKDHDVKLTSILAVLGSLGLKKTLKQFGDTTNEADQCFYATIPVNMRQFLQPPLDNRCCGYWMSRLRINHRTIDLTEENAMSYAHEHSVDFHTRLGEKEQWRPLDMCSKAIPNFNITGLGSHLSFSNIGLQKSTMNPSKRDVRITQYYSGVSFKRHGSSALTQHGLATIDNQLFWSITYSRCEINEEFIQYWINEILNSLQIILSN